MVITRFAPSPTGHLHLGHAFSAYVAATLGNGYLLRIDDIDHTRCRPAFTQQIFDDLQWLGLSWTAPVIFQSDRLAAYDDALTTLRDKGLVYPCYLKRAEINEILSAPHGPDQGTPTAAGAVLVPQPPTHNALSQREIDRRIADGVEPAWRLHSEKAQMMAGSVAWRDAQTGRAVPATLDAFGDVILARKDIGTSYHLSVVVDDAMDNISLVTRGADLVQSTHIHRFLQAVLDLPTPAYFHHPLIVDSAGKRLAKRDKARAVTSLRKSGATAADILSLLPEIPSLSENWIDK